MSELPYYFQSVSIANVFIDDILPDTSPESPLNTSKDPWCSIGVESFKEGLEIVLNKLEELGINPNMFIHEKKFLVYRLFEFLRYDEIDLQTFMEDESRFVRGLALIDEIYRLNVHIPEQLPKLQQLKKAWHYTALTDHSSISAKFRRDNNIPDDIIQDKSAVESVKEDLQIFLNKFTDKDATISFVENNFVHIQEIAQREGLSINFPLPEIHVLNITQREAELYMRNESRTPFATVVYINFASRKIIILPKDFANNNTLEHEILHAFSSISEGGLREGRFNKIRAAIDEANTESKTSSPISYPTQRLILKQILRKAPHLQEVIDDVSYGRKSQVELTKVVFNTFGSRGLNLFDFTADHPMRNLEEYGRQIYNHPIEAIEFFSKYLEYPNFELTRKISEVTKKILSHVEESDLNRWFEDGDFKQNLDRLKQVTRFITEVLPLPCFVEGEDHDFYRSLESWIDSFYEIEEKASDSDMYNYRLYMKVKVFSSVHLKFTIAFEKSDYNKFVV